MIGSTGQLLAASSDVVEFIRHHITDDAQRNLLGSSILLVVFGGVMWLYGARLGRAMVMALFFAIGNGVAFAYRDRLPISPILTIPLGGLIMGGIGGLLYRPLVACLSAVLVTLVAAIVFAAWVVGPKIDLDAILQPRVTRIALAERRVNDLQRAVEALQGQLSQLNKTNPTLVGTAALVLGGSALAGLALGLLAPRAAMILWTSLAGLGFILLGATALLVQYAQEWLVGMGGHPIAQSAACAALFLFGAGYQYHHLRKRSPGTELPAGLIAGQTIHT